MVDGVFNFLHTTNPLPLKKKKTLEINEQGYSFVFVCLVTQVQVSLDEVTSVSR